METDPRDTILPHCRCRECWPGDGHDPDCPVAGLFRSQEERIQVLRHAINGALDDPEPPYWQHRLEEALSVDEEAARG